MRYQQIEKSFFEDNRKRFAALMEPQSVAIFFSADLFPRNGDANHRFRQNSDFFYLSGVDQESCALIISTGKKGEAHREFLFLLETNEKIAIWEGAKLTQEEGKNVSGIRAVYWNDRFQNILKSIVYQSNNIYINLNENDRYSNDVPYKDIRFAEELKLQFPLHNLKRSAPLLTLLRMSKAQVEVDQIKTACGITRDAFLRVLKTVKPGMKEYEVEAEITHEFIRQGASGHAYEPIVAGGLNACVLHYMDNDKTLQAGDMLLMDFGAEYGNYNADLTRTIPVSGRFSKRQKEVYNACLRVHKHFTAFLKSGITFAEITKEAVKVMESELIGLGLFTGADVASQSKENPLYRKYFMHGLGHYLGLDVHDVGNRALPIPENAIITNEPGIYIREESIGIRIENDLLLTLNGSVDLMADIPIEADEIEDIMNSN